MLDQQESGAYQQINLIMKNGQFPPAHEMQVKMINALPAVRTGIDEQAVAPFIHTLIRSDLPGFQDQFPQDVRVFFASLIEGIHMFVGDQQNMHRRRRSSVPEGSDLIVMIDNRGGGFTGGNFTEDTFTFHQAVPAKMKVVNNGLAF